MLRCRNKREKVEKCGRVPLFPQPADHKIVRKTLKPQTVRQF